MKEPAQSAPVTRGASRALQTSALEQSGCSIGDWIACAGIVAACIPACAAGPAACIACMGSAYDRCKDCL